MGDRNFVLNNKKMRFSYPPEIKQGRTMVVLKISLFKEVGASYKEYSRGGKVYVEISKGNNKVTLIIVGGRVGVKHNGREVKLISPPYISAGHIMLPLSDIYRMLGINVVWE